MTEPDTLKDPPEKESESTDLLPENPDERLGMIEIIFLQKYTDPESDTFADITKSAKLAGIKPKEIQNIKTRQWFKDSISRQFDKLTLLAKGNLETYLTQKETARMTDKWGATHNKFSPDKHRTKAEMTKFVLQHVDRDHFHTKSASETTVNVLTISQVLKDLQANDTKQPKLEQPSRSDIIEQVVPDKSSVPDKGQEFKEDSVQT